MGSQLPRAPGGHQGDGVLRREAEALRRHANHRRAAGMRRHFPPILCMVRQDLAGNIAVARFIKALIEIELEDFEVEL